MTRPSPPATALSATRVALIYLVAAGVVVMVLAAGVPSEPGVEGVPGAVGSVAAAGDGPSTEGSVPAAGGSAPGAARLVVAAALVVFLVLSLPVLNLQGRLLVSAALIVGHVLLALYGSGGTSLAATGASTWAAAMTNGAGFAVLFVSIPFSALFIGAEGVGGGGPAGRDGPEGGVAEAADGGGTSAGEPGVTRPRPSLLKVAVVQFALSVALTIGSLWVTRPLYDASGAPRASRYRAVSAAYSGNVAFSPLDPVVNLALVLAGIAYTDYMFLGLTLLVIVVAATMVNEIPLWLRGRGGRAGWARGAKTPGATPGASTADDQDMGATDAGAEVAAGAAPLPPDFAGVFVRAVVLIAIVVAGKLVIALPNEVAETGLILAAVSGALILVVKGPRELVRAFRSHPGKTQQFVSVLALIGAALFLAAAIAESPAAGAVSELAMRASRLPIFVSAIAIVALTSVLAFIGVHMFLTVGTMGALLSPTLLGISAPAFALLLVTSYIVGMNLSPLVPFTIASAELNDGRSSLTAVRHHVPVWLLVALAGCGVVSVL